MSRSSAPHDRAFFMARESTKRTLKTTGYSWPGVIRSLHFGSGDKQMEHNYGLGVAGPSSIDEKAQKPVVNVTVGCTPNGLWKKMAIAGLGNLTETASHLTEDLPGFSMFGYKKVGSEYMVNVMAGGEVNKQELLIDFKSSWITLMQELMGLYIDYKKNSGFNIAIDIGGFYNVDLGDSLPVPIGRVPVRPHKTTLYVATSGELDEAFSVQYTGGGSRCLMRLSGCRLTTYVDNVQDKDISLKAYADINALVAAIDGWSDYDASVDGGGDEKPWTLKPVDEADIKTSSYQTYYIDKSSAKKISHTCADSIKFSTDRALVASPGPYTAPDLSNYHLEHACLDVGDHLVSLDLTMKERDLYLEAAYEEGYDLYFYLDIADSTPFHGIFGPGKVMAPIGADVNDKELISLAPTIDFYGGLAKATFLYE